jgi:hypothetical protein
MFQTGFDNRFQEETGWNCSSILTLLGYGHVKGKGKNHLQQAEVAQGVPGRLRPRIFLTFGTTRVVGRQPYAPAAFTPGEISGTHF